MPPTTGKVEISLRDDRIKIDSSFKLTGRRDPICFLRSKFSIRKLRPDVDAPVVLDLMPALLEELEVSESIFDRTLLSTICLEVPLNRFAPLEDKLAIIDKLEELFAKHGCQVTIKDDPRELRAQAG